MSTSDPIEIEVLNAGGDAPAPDPETRLSTFYFDLGSPYSYLSAERISRLFIDAEIEQPEWQPVLLGGLFAKFDRGSWSQTDMRDEGMAENTP